MRSAPAGGYDAFGIRRQKIREVWALFSRERPQLAAESNVLILPSSEGTEVEIAMRNGFRQDRIYVCDRNPAIVVHLRKRYPYLPRVVGAHGVEIGLAAQRLAKAGVVIHVANLDLCGYYGRPMIQSLHDVAWSGCLSEDALVNITFVRGREQKEYGRWLKSSVERHKDNPETFARVAHLGGARTMAMTRVFMWRNYDIEVDAPVSLDSRMPPIDRALRYLRYAEYFTTMPMAHVTVRLKKAAEHDSAHPLALKKVEGWNWEQYRAWRKGQGTPSARDAASGCGGASE